VITPNTRTSRVLGWLVVYTLVLGAALVLWLVLGGWV
jgi:hypothetical protein